MERENILGVFSSVTDVNSVLNSLGARGYTESDVAILAKEDVVGDIDIDSDKGASLKEGAGEGAKTGGLVGGVLGLLAGLGAIALPGVGALFITGPIAAALGLTGVAAATASGAATGALAGGLIGAFTKLGVDNATAEHLERAVNEGKILVYVVTNDDDDDYVEDLMKNNNAEQVIEAD